MANIRALRQDEIDEAKKAFGNKIQINSKINLCLIVLIFFLLVLGCQPSGGDLIPIAGEGIEITTSRFENDTVMITDNGLTLKFYGSWGGGDGVVLRVLVKNETGKTVKINFDNFLLENGKQKRETVSSVIDKTNNSVLTDKNVVIAAGERRAFRIRFPVPFGNSLREDEAEQTLYFTLPVEIDTKTRIMREFKFVLRGIDQQVAPDKEAPSDW